MISRWPAILFLLGAVSVLTCDDADGGDATGGRGGAPQGGGGGVVAGGGGAGDKDGAAAAGDVRDAADTVTDGGEPPANTSDCFPTCIAQIRRECRRPATGSCVHESWNDSDNYCYSNGVKEIRRSPPFVPATRTSFLTPAGALCYTTEVISPPASTVIEVVFRDADGMEVARGKHGLADSRWQITCNGQTVDVDEASSACATVLPGQCTEGSCR